VQARTNTYEHMFKLYLLRLEAAAASGCQKKERVFKLSQSTTSHGRNYKVTNLFYS
jgi:hypothetical protein